MLDHILTIEKVGKNFGGLRALDGVSLQMPRKQITGLIGPNGAGKTTLFNIITGLYPASGGSIYLDGEPLDAFAMHQRIEKGIGRTFQITRLFRGLTVLENVMSGCLPWTVRNRFISCIGAMFHLPFMRRYEKEILEYSRELLRFAGLDKCANEEAGNLPHGQQRLLEMARALATKPKLLLLDEPAAGLNPHECDILRSLLKSVVDEMGITILLVEHDMRLVMKTCDWVCVLNVGRKIAEGAPTDIGRNEDVVKAYLGKEY